MLRPDERTAPLDANSKRLIQTGQFLAVLAAVAAALTFPRRAMPHAEMLFFAGVFTIITGSLLRRHCWKMLGESFTGAVIVKPDQAVVERGAYRYIRHPSYTAGTLLLTGIGIALANWLSLSTLLASSAVVYAYRVRVEEAALVAVLGEPYRAYIARTKRFIPYLF
ncbi:MAG TPA: isoprenylcysteine carboxylmethyltransferase family protein [Candidatus Baltobacteraceae bacterium]|nr:isoprenylcysteine carboxylmethyltransferase family protein [Candidatus Baltobacteraceae bacterium]